MTYLVFELAECTAGYKLQVKVCLVDLSDGFVNQQINKKLRLKSNIYNYTFNNGRS